MIVNLGGSGGLDFHVVGGTTQPSNPKENTIWVNTSTDIPHYVVHYTPPTSDTYKVNGAIWICDNSLTWRSPAINIAKNKEKLYLPVFPTNVQQYENGAWVVRDAKIFNNGAWVDLIIYFFKSGVGEKVSFEKSVQQNSSCTVATDKITLSFSANSNSVSNVYTKDKQSFKAGDIVVFDAKCTKQAPNNDNLWVRRIGLYSAKNNANGYGQYSYLNAVAATVMTADSSRKLYQIPVEADGSYYVASCGVGNAEIYNIYVL